MMARNVPPNFQANQKYSFPSLVNSEPGCGILHPVWKLREKEGRWETAVAGCGRSSSPLCHGWRDGPKAVGTTICVPLSLLQAQEGKEGRWRMAGQFLISIMGNKLLPSVPRPQQVNGCSGF